MSEAWAPELLDRAERVPVWTRPVQPAFRGTGGFSAWGSPEPEAPVADAAGAEPQVDAFALGFAEGYAAGEAALAEERAALAALAESLRALRPEPPAELGQLLAETVQRLVRQVVGEAQLDGSAIEARAALIASLIAEESAPARLRLHPDDAARLADAALPVELAPDRSLERGALLIETAAGWIEDGPAVRLERLRTQLDALGATR